MKYLYLALLVVAALNLGFTAGQIAGRRRLARELRPLLTSAKKLVERLDAQ